MALTLGKSVGTVQKLKDKGFNYVVTGRWGHTLKPNKLDSVGFPCMKDMVPVFLKKWPKVAERRRWAISHESGNDDEGKR